MNISAFDFELPDELIAQEPLESRAASRMLVVERDAGRLSDSNFDSFPGLLNKDDLVVVNNTKVFPARLYGTSETGARVEIFLVREISAGVWETLAKPARRLKPGKAIVFSDELAAEVTERSPDGRVIIEFTASGDLYTLLDEVGVTPLPPYIKRQPGAIDRDRERYQTVYARSRGAIAAPTAGLHFTPEVIADLKGRGIEMAEITLHVGYGTFEPVRVDNVAEHSVMPEQFVIGEAAAESLNRALTDRRRIIAVGTTTTRALETSVTKHGRFAAESSSADLTIIPGYNFKAINGLLTNFHLPQSSLLILVSTFAGYELIMKAYRYAVGERYRFYSYGDCMLIV